MKHNFVVILKDGAVHFEEVKALSKTKPFCEFSDKGWLCVIGTFQKDEIKEFEYYPLRKDGKMFDWQKASGFEDRPLKEKLWQI